MITRIVTFLCRFAAFKKLFWKKWYDFLAGSYRHSEWTFMNYGYVGAELQTLSLNSADEPERYCIQLYHFVASPGNLKGKRVLEVGCGRGGGASYVKRRLEPHSVTAVDLSPKAIEFCRRRHVVNGLSFEEGSAESLSFGDESFDAVINVESSHCYPSMDAFLREVRRVLKPGGFFLYADFRDRVDVSRWEGQLANCGMKIVRETDITSNVLAGLDEDDNRRSAMIRKLIPKPLLPSFKDFAGARGSTMYEGFRLGKITYRAFTLQKA